MANINELEWATLEGSEYPVAKTTISELEVIIIKLDEDSFILESGDKGHEVNLGQLETVLSTGDIAWSQNSIVIDDNPEPLLSQTELSFISFDETWKGGNPWKKVEGVGDYVLEIPHLYYNPKDNVKLRIIKKDNDTYDLAVIGIPPNDGDKIQYEEMNLLSTLSNYAYANGLSASDGQEYYNRLKAASESTDYETIE